MLGWQATPIWAQWTIEQLSEPRRAVASFTHDGKAFFVGGADDFAGSQVIDVYDSVTGEWSVEEAPVSALGWEVLDAGDYVVLINGSGTVSGTIMIYDKAAGEWSVASRPENLINGSVAALNNKLYIAGGRINSENTTLVQLLDLRTDQWTTAALSVARQNPSVAYHGDKVYFLGGYTNIGLNQLSAAASSNGCA